MKEPEHWMSNIIKSLSDLLNGPVSERVRESLTEIIADLKDQDPHQYWGEREIDY